MTPERIADQYAAAALMSETECANNYLEATPILLDALTRAQQEVADLRAKAQQWALYAFNHHGNDAHLYNGLADLGGVTPDGQGWLAPRTPKGTD